MTMPKEFTRAAEKRITDDWQQEVPALGVYELRWLLRRVGPLLSGICLDRDSGGNVYMPKFHVHFMGKVFPGVSLTLCTQLRSERSGGPDFIEVQWHKEKYQEAAARMVRQSLLPLEGDLSLEQVMDAYRRHMTTPLAKRQPVLLYRDMILLLAWGRDAAGATELLGDCLQLEDAAGFQHVGGRAQLEAECRRVIAKPKLIEDTVAAQIDVLGVRELPVSQLLC